MKKLFLAVCFSFIFSDVWAATHTMASMAEAQSASNANPLETSKKLIEERQRFRTMSPEEMQEYLKERLDQVVINELDKSDGLGGNGAVNVQKSEAQKELEAQQNKSIFEKIYDKAMNNLIDTSKPRPAAKIYTDDKISLQNMQPQAAVEAQQMQNYQNAQRQAWLNSNVNMIDILLPPYRQKTLVPAQEHIPYLFSRIELLPDGLVRLTDTIVVVANGNKLKESIYRAFPKFVIDRSGERQKVDFNLLNVSINGTPVDYKLSDRNNYIFMEPAQKFELSPGVYEYQFDYTIDNQIFSYDEFDEFYWNLTGSVWNLVISRAGAAVILPPNTKTLGQIALSGYPGYWRDDTIAFTQEQDNVLGFVSQTPLFIGQAMNIVISLPKGSVSNVSWSKMFLRFVNANGDILFSAMGLIAIALSYLVSWNYIRKSKNKPLKSIYKNSSLLRYFAKGVIDKKSFAAFLLELYRKNIIDIEENDNNILLVKKTDNLSSLTKPEKKALHFLFGNDEAILNINSFSALKINKAIEFMQKNTNKQIRQLNFRLNIGYLLFSIGMLLFAEAAIAFLNYDFAYNFMFLVFTTCMLVFCLWLFQQKFTPKWKNTTSHIAAVLLACITAFVMLAIVNLWTVIIIAVTLVVIQEFSKLYAQRNGLLSAYVKEAQNFAALLKSKADAICLGKDFAHNQAAILALDLEECYPPLEQNKNIYKLDIISKLLEKI